MNNLVETDFYLPRTLDPKDEAHKLYQTKFTEEDKNLSLEYDGFEYKPGMVKCHYTYYLDNTDVDFLIGCLCDKFGISDKQNLFPLLNYIQTGEKFCPQETKFDILYDFLNSICDISPEDELYIKLKAHCYEKAQKEFKLSFAYWVRGDAEYDYYEYEIL